MNRSLTYLSLLILLALPACLTFRPASNRAENRLNLYNPGSQVLHPQFRIYHSTGRETIVFINLLASEVLFNQANPQVKSQAKLEASFVLYSSLSNNEIAARDTQEFTVDRDKVETQIVLSMKLPTETGKTYLLDITIADRNRQSEVRERLLVDRFLEYNQQDWLVINYPGNQVAFEHFFYPGESFRLIHQGTKAERIYISVYPPASRLPAPPFDVTPQPDTLPLPDSTFYMAYSEQLLYKLGGEGIYLFHLKRETPKGLCLTQFGDHYPQVTEPEDMLEPLQYITTPEEYRQLSSGTSIKQSIDEFWLDRGKTYPNARDLIRVYYNRVVFANLYFPSARQGWCTDRGMIYLLFGPPRSVQRTETRETWLYESADTEEKVTFEFNLEEDYLLGYEFRLKRKEDYRTLWNRAVESWKRGKIFSI